MLFFRTWACPIVSVVSLSSSEALLGLFCILERLWCLVGFVGGVLLKAPMRFVGNFAGRNSIGRPLGARIKCIVVYKIGGTLVVSF